MLGHRDVKVSTRDCFLLVSWFLSKKSEEAAASIGVDLIGMVKTNTISVLQGNNRGVNKGLAWKILHSVDE